MLHHKTIDFRKGIAGLITCLAIAGLCLMGCEKKPETSDKADVKAETAAPAEAPKADNDAAKADNDAAKADNDDTDKLNVDNDLLDKQAIQKVVRGGAGAIKSCYETELANNKDLADKEITVKASWQINAEGNVDDDITTDINVKDGKLNDDTFAKCITDTIKSFKFPAPKDGGKVKVDYPFVFDTKPHDDNADSASLDKEVIQGVVKEHTAEIRTCYENELKNNKELAGKLDLSWTVGAEGTVTEVVAKENTLNKAVEDCVVEAIKKWTFPAPKGGETVKVDYPFVFDSKPNE